LQASLKVSIKIAFFSTSVLTVERRFAGRPATRPEQVVAPDDWRIARRLPSDPPEKRVSRD
jgi:hypothetical protein